MLNKSNKRWIGLTGSHRVGKTTLAQEFAAKHGYTFVPANISEIQRKHGYDSSRQDYSFQERMHIQELILKDLELQYETLHAGSSSIITDRTPHDLMIYALLAVNDKCTAEDYERLSYYITRCQFVTKMNFDDLFIVQPGIPVIPSPTSAAASRAFMHKFNSLLMGEIYDDEWVNVIPSYMLNLNNRILYIESNLRNKS